MSDLIIPKGEGERWRDPNLLDHLAALREPFDGLARRLVHHVLDEYLPGPFADAKFLEIGSGGGHLRTWLPDRFLDLTTHTEPSTEYLGVLGERHPQAAIVQADCYELPFPDAHFDAVFGLCTFDALQEPTKARDELARVLKPGGLFVHFLDLGSDLEAVFRETILRGELPLPNFLSEEALSQSRLTDQQRGSLPATDPLDDVLLTNSGEFGKLCRLLERTGHPLGERLGPYSRLFDPKSLDSRAALSEYYGLVSDRRELSKLEAGLLALYLSGNERVRGEFLAWSIRPLSTLRIFEEKLETLFGFGSPFTFEESGVLRVGESRPRDTTIPDGCAYKGRWIGKTVTRRQPPTTIPGTLLDDYPVEEGCSRHELAMHVFVAFVNPTKSANLGS